MTIKKYLRVVLQIEISNNAVTDSEKQITVEVKSTDPEDKVLILDQKITVENKRSNLERNKKQVKCTPDKPCWECQTRKIKQRK
jgi:hypothetical protein